MMPLGWKRLVVLALVVTIGAMFVAACDSTQSPSTAPASRAPSAINVGVTPAIIGSITMTRLYAATVKPKDQVDVVPQGSGRLEKLTVDVGSEVKAGQTIAELAHGTLDAQLGQAQAGLRDARARLDSVRAGAEPDQITAQARLDAVVAKLDQLLNPPPAELRAEQSSVDTAQSKLNSANTKLEQLRNPSASDLQAAGSSVATARSKLDSANTKLEQIRSPSASDLQTGVSAVATAQSTLNITNTKLDQLLNPSSADLAAAQQAVSDAQSKLSSAQSKTNQSIAAEISAATVAPDLRDSLQSLLDSRLRLQAFDNKLLNQDPSTDGGLTPAEVAETQESAAQVRKTVSRFWAEVNADPTLVPEAVTTRTLDETAAQTAVETAQEELEELQTPARYTIDVAENDVAIAQASVDSAVASLRELQNPGEDTIALARDAVAIAKASLDSASANLAEVQNPSQSTIALAHNDVDVAQASLDAAASSLELLENPRLAALAGAQAEVTAAEQALALTHDPYKSFKVEIAQAAVDRAQAQIDLVRQLLEERQVFAPFDGLVSHRWLTAGAMASPQTPIVTIIGLDVLVSMQVEETAINSLQEGQQLPFTGPALHGEELQLQIAHIAPIGDEKTYTFTVELQPTGTTEDLRSGMSGQVLISTRSENSVLVPKGAVLRQAGQTTVFVIQDGKARLRTVDVGLTDGKHMEILGGIQPGDQIVVSGHNLLSEGDPVNVAVSNQDLSSPG